MIGKSVQPELSGLIESRDANTLREFLQGWLVPDLAELIADIPENDQAVLFRLMPRNVAAEVFEYLGLETQKS
ncbi:MAG: magnesium transporter, partial [Ignavibacteria bacterium]|nr:magnesium transporter [Ignavibacteria bacterium]